MHARVLVAGDRARRGRPSSTPTIDGIPAIPSRAETAPSCITPSPESAGSSSCSAITPPAQPLVLERLAQHPGRGDRLAVVGEAERAGVAQRGHLGQLLARAGRRVIDGQEAGRHPRLLRWRVAISELQHR